MYRTPSHQDIAEVMIGEDVIKAKEEAVVVYGERARKAEPA